MKGKVSILGALRCALLRHLACFQAQHASPCYTSLSIMSSSCHMATCQSASDSVPADTSDSMPVDPFLAAGSIPNAAALKDSETQTQVHQCASYSPSPPYLSSHTPCMPLAHCMCFLPCLSPPALTTLLQPLPAACATLLCHCYCMYHVTVHATI